MRRLLTVLAGTVTLVAVLCLWLYSSVSSRTPEVPAAPPDGCAGRIAEVTPAVVASTGSALGENEDEESSVPVTDEPCAEIDADRRVEAFDALTDKWLEHAAKGVAMSDVDAFVRLFSLIPKDRKEECLHRACNLIPDENVMLLAGILMDKTQGKDLIELVFNDVLNRDEDIKKPIMLQVFKDRTHPCWADVAWILDVTGAIPEKNETRLK